MKLDQWLRFTWELATFPTEMPPLPEHYEINRAEPDVEKHVRSAISTAFTLDPAWNGAAHNIEQTVDMWLDRAFAEQNTALLVLRHGSRIIGASVVSLAEDSDFRLAPGPCILVEYRNRGFGTHLLAHSLGTLRDAGIRHGTAITKEGSPAAKFLYPKFNGLAAPCDFQPLAAA
ncbi:MAG: GNAT family N-acetyltransferase [Chthoniobacterales bacterium]|jgi:ribosomal protein S18 acetylase RimI-like enzyme